MIRHTMIVNDGGKWMLVQNANTPFEFDGTSRISVYVSDNVSRVRWDGFGRDWGEMLDELSYSLRLFGRRRK